ncbi:MAG TPA: hypothetical protein VFX71_05800 [Hyphomicrobium sp.]|nr:hypothetical protein [Hyphomicrobium sp.]
MVKEDDRRLLTHTSLFAAVMSKARYLFASRIEDGVGTVQTMGLTGGVDVQERGACSSPDRAFRHNFALQSNAADRACDLGQKYNWLINLLMKRQICPFRGAAAASASRCGTLTYRHMWPAKRKPCGQIAASQQIRVRNGDSRGGSNRKKPIGPLTQSGDGERRAEALSHDVLGFGVAIGLIRFVRSASIRG